MKLSNELRTWHTLGKAYKLDFEGLRGSCLLNTHGRAKLATYR